MAFTLTISKGPDDGTEFAFTEKQATLGRTADNDIVVKDAGASRAHAKVYEEGFRYFIEDLKSANGTKVNSALISEPRELKNGDTITIGEVSFRFGAVEATVLQPALSEQELAALAGVDPNATVLKMGDAPGPSTDEVPAPVDPNATMLKPPEELEKIRASWQQAVAPAPAGKTPTVAEVEGLETIAPSSRGPRAIPAPEESAPPPPPPRRRGGALARRSEDEGLRPSGGGDTKEVVNLTARGGRGGGDDEGSAMTAAEKARRRRDFGTSPAGKLKVMWAELSRNGRIAVGGGGGLLGLLLLGALVWGLMPAENPNARKLGPEPTALVPNGPTVENSFGLGDGVDYKNADLKMFSFNTQSPTRVVALVHYLARDISKDEVVISLNGAEIGAVPPDTMDVASRELELVLPSLQLKPGVDNQLVFDSVRNPPSSDPWRISNIWLEVLPMPELSAEQTLVEANTAVERAKKAYGLRDVGPGNLFRAWKLYRDAWLLLESLPDRGPDTNELYESVRLSLKQLRPELDRKCSALMLEVQQELQLNNADYRKIRSILTNVTEYFPTREHRCHDMSLAILSDLGG